MSLQKDYDLFKTLVPYQNFDQFRSDRFYYALVELNRLKNFVAIKNKVSDQLIDLSKYSLIRRREVYFESNDLIDQRTQKLIANCKPDSRLAPVKIFGDGNCLYRSLSKALYGVDNFYAELRFRVVVELVFNKDRFLRITRIQNGKKTNFYDHLCPEPDNSNSTPESVYDTQVLKATFQSGIEAFSSVWHIFAAAQALVVSINQIYPCMKKNFEHSMIQFMNRSIHNLDTITQGEVNVAWTHASKGVLNGGWQPNHFVCLILKTKPERASKQSMNPTTEDIITQEEQESNESVFENKVSEKNSSNYKREKIESDREYSKKKQKRNQITIFDLKDENISMFDEYENVDSDAEFQGYSDSEASFGDDCEDNPNDDIQNETEKYKDLSSCHEVDLEFEKIEDDEHPEDCNCNELEEENLEANKVVQALEVDIVNDENIYFESIIKYAFLANTVSFLPKAKRNNSVFLIDLNIFQIKDVLSDDNGSYIHYGNKTKIYSVVKDSALNVVIEKVDRFDSQDKTIYSATKLFYKSRSEPKFMRKTIRIKSVNGNDFDKLVLVYHNGAGCNENFEPKPHGNSTKVFRPYIRTSKSTLDEIKKVSVMDGSAPLKINKLVEQSNVKGELCNLPRNISQLYKHKSLQLKDSNMIQTKNDIYDALLNRNKDFVRSIMFNENFVAVMFTDEQYKDLIRFGSGDFFSIINVDTTFNLGQYYVTLITYRNLALVDVKTKKHPTFIGGIMIHTRRDKDSYQKLPSVLIDYDLQEKKMLQDIKCIITDDDKSLHGAFKEYFPRSDFLLCCNHLRKDMIRRFGYFNVTIKDQEEALEMIFGSRSRREQSLIGSKNPKQFVERCNNIIQRLNEFKRDGKYLGDWFYKYKWKKMYNNFCKIKWKYTSSLSIDYYSTNDVEGINNQIKLFSQRKRMSLSQIFVFFEELSKKQTNDSILAIRKAGPYEISQKYIKFEVVPQIWETFHQKKKDRWINSFLESDRLIVNDNIKVKKEYGFHVEKKTKNRKRNEL